MNSIVGFRNRKDMKIIRTRKPREAREYIVSIYNLQLYTKFMPISITINFTVKIFNSSIPKGL